MSPHPTHELVDARDRERAENDLSTTYLVEAAAGTGKTTLLVSRILTIVRETLTPLSAIVAITFTEKAAGELKIKLRERLEEGARGDDEAALRYHAALGELDMMPVSTIHAFCRDLISQRPVEAGVEPGFTMADEQASRMLTDELWQSWIATQFASECAVARPFLELGLRPDGTGNEHSLRTLFELLNNYREDLDSLRVPCLDEISLRTRINAFTSECRSALDLLRGCSNEQDLLAQEILKVARWFRAGTWDDPHAAWTHLARCEKPHGGRKGKKENWNAAEHEAAREYFLNRFFDEAGVLAGELVSFHAAPLVEWLKDAVREYARAKDAQAMLDFHDLLILARNMLRYCKPS